MTGRSLVEALLTARKTGEQIDHLQDDWHLDSQGMAVETMLHVADQLGWERLGWKIAATNEELQRKLRTTEPVFGMTFKQFLMHSPASVLRASLLDPIIECEFAFKMSKSLPDKGDEAYVLEDLVQCIEWVAPCIEIAECRFNRRNLPSARFIQADGFASGRYVVGEPIEEWQLFLDNGVNVSLFRNDQLHSSGHSSDVMGHPLLPLLWLGQALKRVNRRLEPGDVVCTGSCNILCPAREGDQFTVHYEGLAPLKLSTP